MNKFLIRPELSILAFVLAVAIIVISTVYTVYQALPIAVVLLVLVLVFRNPRRTTAANALAIVAPIDCVVTKVTDIESKELEQAMILIRLKRRLFGIIALYSPIQAQIYKSWYGETYIRYDAKGCLDLGHIYTAHLKNNEHDSVLVSFFRASIPRYLQINSQPGERVGQGRAMGLSSIKYVDVLVPCSSKVQVKQGDVVKAGESTLAFLNHKKGKK